MMWMMGYNDGGDFNSTIQDPFAGRGKLRPLIPRPVTAAAVATSPPCLARIHGTDLLALNHHLAMVEQNKRELNTQQVVVSSRWNPTPEQLQTLEELYRRGTRTPSAEQIQQITAQLRRYGKIEGKNVFYWFQNHKARERQKRRRQHDEQQQPHYVNGDKRSEAPGANRTVFEVEQTKNWASPTNSSTVAERGLCTQGAASAKAAAAAAEASECKADGWVHFDEEDDDDTDMLLQNRRNATWQSMHLSSCSSSSSPTTNLVNTSSAHPTVANCATVIPSTFGTILQTSKPPHQDHLINILFKPYTSQSFEDHSAAAGEEAQTLQLFPLQSGRSRHRQWADQEEEDEEEEGSDVGMSTNSCHAPPYQFFEFLPLKN